jgi:hypothetical protein
MVLSKVETIGTWQKKMTVCLSCRIHDLCPRFVEKNMGLLFFAQTSSYYSEQCIVCGLLLKTSASS